jgi:hypothetical protein
MLFQKSEERQIILQRTVAGKFEYSAMVCRTSLTQNSQKRRPCIHRASSDLDGVERSEDMATSPRSRRALSWCRSIRHFLTYIH